MESGFTAGGAAGQEGSGGDDLANLNNALGASLAAAGEQQKSYREKLAEKRGAGAGESGAETNDTATPAADAEPPKPSNPDDERMEKFRAALADIQ